MKILRNLAISSAVVTLLLGLLASDDALLLVGLTAFLSIFLGIMYVGATIEANTTSRHRSDGAKALPRAQELAEYELPQDWREIVL